MKYSKILVLLIIGLVLSSCGKQIVQSFSISTSLENEQSISPGNSFDLDISVIDEDGISSVEISIVSLDFHESFDNINAKKWSFSKKITIDQDVTNGEKEIKIIIKDSNNTERVEYSTIKVL